MVRSRREGGFSLGAALLASGMRITPTSTIFQPELHNGLTLGRETPVPVTVAQMSRRLPLRHRRGDEVAEGTDGRIARAMELHQACERVRAATRLALENTPYTADAQEAFAEVWQALDAAERAAALLSAAIEEGAL